MSPQPDAQYSDLGTAEVLDVSDSWSTAPVLANSSAQMG